jgi:hypothetical protein
MVLIAMLESGMPLWFRCMLAVGYARREISQEVSLQPGKFPYAR